jgi:hypothetical protein
LDAIYDQVAYEPDPDTAKQALAAAIDARAQERIAQQREAAEVKRSQEALIAWTQANPNLAADDTVMGILERNVHNQLAKDLVAAGYEPAQLNPSTVAQLHMKMRAGGHNVRSIDQIFDAARSDYLTWRNGGVRPAPRTDESAPPRREGAPRVEVNVNREERRRLIPTQPPRTANPLRQPLVANPEQSQNENRAAAFQKIAAARAAGRGRYVEKR